MAGSDYLRLKGRTSYFRRKVPADLMSRFASREICVRLGIINRDSARHYARRLAVDVDAFFVMARENPMLTSNDLTRLLHVAKADWVTRITPAPTPSLSPRRQAQNLARMADSILC